MDDGILQHWKSLIWCTWSSYWWWEQSNFTKFAVDMQFLVEIARRGGYLTTNMINFLKDLVLEMESAIVSGGFGLNRLPSLPWKLLKDWKKKMEVGWWDWWGGWREWGLPIIFFKWFIEDDDDKLTSKQVTFQPTKISREKGDLLLSFTGCFFFFLTLTTNLDSPFASIWN